MTRRPFLMVNNRVWVLNGWAANPAAWSLCRFPRERIFSFVEQLAGLPEATLVATQPKVVLVGWSMGGSSALRIACDFPEKIAGLVLIAATPRMMVEPETGWRGMTPHRLEALRKGLELTHGEGFLGPTLGRPNPYTVDTPENLERGLVYLRETDLRAKLLARFGKGQSNFPVQIFQSEHDGIVRAENALWLKTLFPQAKVVMVPGGEHALPVSIPADIDAAVGQL